MRRADKKRALTAALGPPAREKGDELVFFCPRHAHRKPKLSVDVVGDRFHCWFCDWSGSSLRPILKLGLPEFLAEYDPPRRDGFERRGEEKKKPRLPAEFSSLSSPSSSPYYRRVLKYLRSRGMTADDVVRWRVGYCEEGEYKGRAVFPSFDARGELNFFVGRSLRDGGGLSYKHGEFDKNIVWNECDVDWESPVVLVEGLFDAVKAGENSIPLLGSSLSTNSVVFSRLADRKPPVYLAFDEDAQRKQLTIALKLRSVGVECFLVPLSGKKDVGEMTKEEFASAREQSRPFDGASDLIRESVFLPGKMSFGPIGFRSMRVSRSLSEILD